MRIDPMGPITYNDAAALLLDYYRRFGPLQELNSPQVLEQLATRKSRPPLLNYQVVVRRLNELRKGEVAHEGLQYEPFVEVYFHAAATGPDQARNFLSERGIWIEL
jgi:hypothetical protein